MNKAATRVNATWGPEQPAGGPGSLPTHTQACRALFHKALVHQENELMVFLALTNCIPVLTILFYKMHANPCINTGQLMKTWRQNPVPRHEEASLPMPAPPGPHQRPQGTCNPGAKTVLLEETQSISYLTEGKNWLAHTTLSPTLPGEACGFSGSGTPSAGKSGTVPSHKAPDKDGTPAPASGASRIHPKPQACGGRVKKNKKNENCFGNSCCPPVSLFGFFCFTGSVS